MRSSWPCIPVEHDSRTKTRRQGISPMAISLSDDYGRTIDYLRISINRECNYACEYCDKEGYLTIEKDQVLSASDVAAIIQAFNDVGSIRKVKITGGEPLLHPDVVDVVATIHAIAGVEEISLTTNGYFLKRMALELKKAGLNRVNISLPSINHDTYEKITGVDGLDTVLAGIDEAIYVGLVPIKINFVLLKGLNDTELDGLLEFCGSRGTRLQLIELHEVDEVHTSKKSYFDEHYIDVEEAVQNITLPVERVEFRDMQHRKIIHYTNGVSIEVVKISPAFCANCTKLRVTAEGKIKPCLMKPAGSSFDLLAMLHEGRRGAEIKALIAEVMQERKPFMQGEVTECQ